MHRVVRTEEQKLENGGPGQPGERVLRPAGTSAVAPGPGTAPAPAAAQPSARPSAPAGEATPGTEGSQTSVPSESPAPAPAPAPPPPENPERLGLQPDTGNQR